MKQITKLADLKQKLKDLQLDGFIVPRGDEFLGEFVPKHAERLAWLTGFTGSAGMAVVGLNTSAVLSDGRYDIQLKQQVNQQDFEILNITKTKPDEWIVNNFPEKSVIGYDPMLHTPAQIKQLRDKCVQAQIDFRPVTKNPIDEIWLDQPAQPARDVFKFPDHIAGLTSFEKRQKIAKSLKEQGCFGVFLAQPDSVAWILNIRGSDIPHNPFALSRGFLHAEDGSFDWFIEPDRVDQLVSSHLGEEVRIHPPSHTKDMLGKIAAKAKAGQLPISFDHNRSPVYFLELFKKNDCEIKQDEDPCLLPRAKKTQSEAQAMREIHIQDGAAMVRFLKWLEDSYPEQELTEMDVARKIDSLRSELPGFYNTSFDTIAGFGSNGAIVHYRVSDKTNLAIIPPALMLVDSGGQYFDEQAAGTTDITRTISIGDVDQRIKRHFTRVLKGHIKLASARFPYGTNGSQLDSFARESLWEAGLDYAHGTGHGVGCFLSVHEEAATLSPKGSRTIEPGMILSNEPGYYETDSHGIRIENLILTKSCGETLPVGRDLLEFETISLAPIDTRLIITQMMTEDEKTWLNDYHSNVLNSLSPELDEECQDWLKYKCEPV